MPRNWCSLLAVAATLTMFASGCALGPAALKSSRMPYNEAIQRTTSEQLLLNLVRLRYREAPLFLEVGGVAAQFTFRESASVEGRINEGIRYQSANNPNLLDLGAQFGYEEKPTITYSPLQGEDFVKRLLAPVPLDTLVLLTRSGWNVDRVLRLAVNNMNGLDNASRASGPTPDQAPRHAEFARAVRLMRRLQHDGALQIGYEASWATLSEPIPTTEVSPEDLLSAAKEGYRFESVSNTAVVLTGPEQSLVWRILPEQADSPPVRELIELLGLMPGQVSYEVHSSAGRQTQRAAARSQETTIDIATRSLMGVLFYLSQAVEAPRPHVERGLVTLTLDEDGQPFDWTRVTGDLLRVRCGATPPRGAAVAVPYRGHWFYIDDSDLTSKSTFGLLSQLFALQAGGEVHAAPVLTLPVGG